MSAEVDERLVEATLHLLGGHCHEIVLPADSELLKELLSAVAGDAAGMAPRMFQLPADGGRMCCSFSSRQLVSVTTRPPVLIEIEQHSGLSQAAGPQAEVSASARVGEIAAAKWVQIDEFLSAVERKQLIDWTLDHVDGFGRGGVGSDDADHRTTKANYQFWRTDLARRVIHRVLIHMPLVLRRLEIEPFRLDDVEAQLTASSDGDYYRPHVDRGDEGQTGNRELTYVYYFHRMPKAFTGGELRLFDSRTDGTTRRMEADRFHDIDPLDNSLIVFPSTEFHEVRPIASESMDFADSRFAITGWIRSRAQDVTGPTFGWGDFHGMISDLRLACDP